MKTCEIFTTDELTEQIFFCAKEQFTGRLDVNVDELQDKQWSLYFCEGLIWGGSGVHPIRSWYRQLSRHCPQLVIEPIGQESAQPLCTDYDTLADLVKQGKIPRDQMVELVENQVIEILFDIIQQREQLPIHAELRFTYQPNPEYFRDKTLFALISLDDIWWQARKYWDAWQESDLLECSPNSAPVVVRPEELQRHTSKLVYDNLTALGNGNWTLRDLAVKLNRSLLSLSKPIMPYVHDGLIGLIEVQDLSDEKPSSEGASHELSKAQPASPTNSESESTRNRTHYLVACIDDSQVDTQIMNHILNQAGYHFINIENQEKALPTLILHKPDLIFLDLIMPIANGYEICAQIRRLPFFKYTPVIIVTGKNGITDRARAKLVGSSDFLVKPINREKVMKVLHTYLPTPQPV
jgi:chemotaxis family two-component system response regulator PixG